MVRRQNISFGRKHRKGSKQGEEENIRSTMGGMDACCELEDFLTCMQLEVFLIFF